MTAVNPFLQGIGQGQQLAGNFQQGMQRGVQGRALQDIFSQQLTPQQQIQMLTPMVAQQNPAAAVKLLQDTGLEPQKEQLVNSYFTNLSAGRLDVSNQIGDRISKEFPEAFELLPEGGFTTQTPQGDLITEKGEITVGGKRRLASTTYNKRTGEVVSSFISKLEPRRVTVTETGAKAKAGAEGKASAQTPTIYKMENLTIGAKKGIDDKLGDLKTDSEYKSGVKSLNGINRVLGLLEQNTAGAQGFIRRALLEASGEQRFTDQDINQMKGSQSLKAELKRFLKEKADGTLTKKDISDMKSILTQLQKTNKQVVLDRTGSVLGELEITRTTSPELTQQIINEKLALDIPGFVSTVQKESGITSGTGSVDGNSLRKKYNY